MQNGLVALKSKWQWPKLSSGVGLIINFAKIYLKICFIFCGLTAFTFRFYSWNKVIPQEYFVSSFLIFIMKKFSSEGKLHFSQVKKLRSGPTQRHRSVLSSNEIFRHLTNFYIGTLQPQNGFHWAQNLHWYNSRKVWFSEFGNAAFCKIYFRTDEMPHMPKYEPTLISYDDAKLEMPWGIGVETSIWP